MSNKREREKRREQRLQEESQSQNQDQRKRLLQIGAGAIFLVIVVVVVLIVANSGGSGGGDAENVVEVSNVDSLLKGIPQEGLVLGQAKAPVDLMEYGDLQCPVCKAYSEEVLPGIIENQVRQGKAKLSFHNFMIIGPDSLPAGAAALAAGKQGRGWNYLELFYRNQGEENSGYVTDDFMASIAKGAGVKNMAQWEKERKSAALKSEAEKTTAQAETYGFSGTPSFAIKGPNTNGVELLGTPESKEELEEAIAKAS